MVFGRSTLRIDESAVLRYPLAAALTFACLCILLSADSASARAGRSAHRAAKTAARSEKVAAQPEKSVAWTGVVKVPFTEVHAKPAQKSELVTQVLLNDDFLVEKEAGDWAYGSIPAQKDYHGWIQTRDLAPKGPAAEGRRSVTVKVTRTSIAGEDGNEVAVFAGTRLPVEGESGDMVKVVLPGGSTGHVPAKDVMFSSRRPEEATPQDIMAAGDFLGTDYRWGGITVDGLDCSGFVYTVYRINGIIIKRDSYLQAEEGIDVSLKDLREGDLVFFKGRGGKRISHVGIYIGYGNFIHASRSRRGVAVSSLSEPSFRNSLVAARRIIVQADRTASESIPAPLVGLR